MQGGAESAGVREGDILAGKYRVERVLGVGGMGVVVAAHHIQLDEKVALKFLLPSMLANQEAVGRFAREARAAVKIKSEHVARVLDVGTLDTGAPYMVMEYLEGGDLGAWLQQRGGLPVEQAVEFVIQACAAVAEAHALGIVHRDLKPANLFCVRRADGQLSIKVLDFGISKVTDLTGSAGAMGLTKTTALMGSPLYMSPEQMHTPRDVDARTDIWAMGVVLYELLTRVTPFQGETVPEVALKIAMAVHAPMRGLRPDAPPGLEAVITRCLEKDRSRRYRHVGELAIDLAPFGPMRSRALVERIAGVIQSAKMAPLSVSVSDGPASQASVATGTLAALGRTTGAGRNGKMALGAAGLTVALAGVLALVLRPAPKPVERAPASTQAASAAPAGLRAPDPPPAVAPPLPTAAPEASSTTPAVAKASPAAPALPTAPAATPAAQRSPRARPTPTPPPTTPAPATKPADQDPFSKLKAM